MSDPVVTLLAACPDEERSRDVRQRLAVPRVGGRTLRSLRRRLAVWKAQDGICAWCGKYMEEGDWEIDHPEPYRITHRTNFHELEALHRKCNRQKGGRTSVEIRNRDKLRKGQREAIQMLGDRVRRGERTTA